jgi:hypothetical protein
VTLDEVELNIKAKSQNKPKRRNTGNNEKDKTHEKQEDRRRAVNP